MSAYVRVKQKKKITNKFYLFSYRVANKNEWEVREARVFIAAKAWMYAQKSCDEGNTHEQRGFHMFSRVAAKFGGVIL